MERLRLDSDRRWLVTVSSGMLGRDVLTRLAGCDARGAMRADVDIASFEEVTAAVRGIDIVGNAAAWTAVDEAETSESAAFDINAMGAANLACVHCLRRLAVHVSTDYVFREDGLRLCGRSAQAVRGDAVVAPRTAYGVRPDKGTRRVAVRSLAPANYHVIRAAWPYGKHARSFVRTMNRLATERDEVNVFQVQVGQPNVGCGPRGAAGRDGRRRRACHLPRRCVR